MSKRHQSQSITDSSMDDLKDFLLKNNISMNSTISDGIYYDDDDDESSVNQIHMMKKYDNRYGLNTRNGNNGNNINDDDINGMVSSQGEFLLVENTNRKSKSTGDVVTASGNYDDISGVLTSNNSDYFNSINSIDLLMPNCLKINRILSEHGNDPLQFKASDVNVDDRTISVFVVDLWAECILKELTVNIDRLDKHQHVMQDVSYSMRKGDVTVQALQARLAELQVKLYEIEKKEALSMKRMKDLEDEKDMMRKRAKADTHEQKKALHNLESQISESERRVRQRDIEIDRLRDKLRHVVNKDKDVNVKHRNTLSSYKQGLISAPSSPGSSSIASSSFTSPAYKRINSNNGGGSSSSTVSSRKNQVQQQQSAADIIEALEYQRDALMKRNVELDNQVLSLAEELRNSENNYGSGGNSHHMLRRNHNQVHHDIQEDALMHVQTVTQIENLNALIEQHQRRIEQLQHRCDEYKKKNDDSISTIESMRTYTVKQQELIDNLRIELEARPTVKQMKQKQKEVEEIENKMHDLVMKRGEIAEIQAWKKHLDTSERIRIDRKNHELGLWLFDSLPKAIMKENLQGICRELDLSEISDVIPAIAKLKKVVQAVPRMERFITDICTFLYDRDCLTGELKRSSSNLSSLKPIMDGAIGTLTRWWERLILCDELITFSTVVSNDLTMRDKNFINGIAIPASTAAATAAGYIDYSDDIDTLKGKTHKDIVLKIRNLIALESKVIQHNTSYKAAEEFVKDKPEVLINRILTHLLFLFHVKDIDGLLPALNKVYLRHQENLNFIKEMKDNLGITTTDSDDTHVIYNELRRITSRLYSK